MVELVLLLLVVMLVIFFKMKKKKLTMAMVIFTGSFFLAVSFPFFPRYVAKQLENRYSSIQPTNAVLNGEVYIHVLGAGYSLDERLPATGKLNLVTLGRLVEAIRIYRACDDAKIVTSGYSSRGFESQASIVKKAATALGVSEEDVFALETPSDTYEEATALRARFGTDINLVIATDALHMPRAIKFFKSVGFNPVAAPTNFRITDSKATSFYPSAQNIQLSNMVIHEYLGNLKGRIFYDL